MKRSPILYCLISISCAAPAQKTERPVTPDIVYGDLFRQVQMLRIFPDNKTFVDCQPVRDPAAIMSDYQKLSITSGDTAALRAFVLKNFSLPGTPALAKPDKNATDIRNHIKQLWEVLKRPPEQPAAGNSLLPLPYPYVVPGGRFGEIYYWDSYFTMLGLQVSGQQEAMEGMLRNFAWMIDQYGHIPNGNRSYFLSRSQPPFFSLMVELLAGETGDSLYTHYLPQLQREHDYWMDRSAPTRHVITMPDGSLLNRYYDQDSIPRQESYFEDSTLAVNYNGDKAKLYRNLRSGAESGWDFSSRWLTESSRLETIRVTDLVPVDLNSLLYHLESTLAKVYGLKGDRKNSKAFATMAQKRKEAINKYCWSPKNGWYMDYDLIARAPGSELTLAGISPFFFGIAPKKRVAAAATMVSSRFLKPGGVVTSLKHSGQQWDAPNGWAPLQWMTISGLARYGQEQLASEIANRWVKLNIQVYERTGKLMEKYNVEDLSLPAGGGEYPSQDGFGWTNGVLLRLLEGK